MAVNEIVPCDNCERNGNCINYLSCLNCNKIDPILNLQAMKKAPSLRVYAERCIENFPLSPSYVAVDKEAIRFFTQKPFFANNRWVSSNANEEIATFRYNTLDGLFDLTPFLKNNLLSFKSVCLEIC